MTFSGSSFPARLYPVSSRTCSWLITMIGSLWTQPSYLSYCASGPGFRFVDFAFWKAPTRWWFPSFDKHTLYEIDGYLKHTILKTGNTLSIASFSMMAPHTGTRVLYCRNLLNACSWSWLHWYRTGHASNNMAENRFNGSDGNFGFSSLMKSS